MRGEKDLKRPGGMLTDDAKRWAYGVWCEGETLDRIAAALYVSKQTVRRIIGDRPKKRPPLTYREGDGKKYGKPNED